MKSPSFVLGGLLFLLPASGRAGCCDHETPVETHRAAAAIAEYRVASVEPFRGDDGTIRTLYRLSLNQSLKGEAPGDLEVVFQGGRIGDEMEFSSVDPNWIAGEDQILHLEQLEDGSWRPTPFRSRKNSGTPAQKKALRDFIRKGASGPLPEEPRQHEKEGSGQGNAGVPGSRITTTGYFESNGVPCRFTTCDSGAAIPCIVDIDPAKLPAGTNAAAALQIVQNALTAWSGASSLKFRVEGTTSFGAGANTIATPDRKLRIQLHNNYNEITSTTTLGIGGGSWTVDAGSGATIGGRTFNVRKYGYVVLNHKSSSMSNAQTFAEVLTHELGHALGLEHSSGASNENNAILKDATMYYQAHSDGRAADIRTYDEDRILYGYPLNTPPSALDRTLRVVTGSPQPTGFGVDRITINTFDAQTPASLTVALISSTAINGTFTLSGTTLSYACGNIGDYQLTDAQIEGGTYNDLAYFQVSDGVNLSPKQKLVITGYHNDPQPSDGLPNSWLTSYFGAGSPGAVGSSRHPESDPDGDGLTNRVERYLGTHPLNASSGLPKVTFNRSAGTLSFTPLRYAPHEIESSTTLGTWTKRQSAGTFSTPAAQTIDVSGDAPAAKMFYRLNVTP